MKLISLKLDEELLDELDDVVELLKQTDEYRGIGLTRSGLMRMLLERGCEDLRQKLSRKK